VRVPSNPPQRHEDFSGASGSAVHFRPARLTAAAMPAGLVCRFRCEGAAGAVSLSLIDLSATGFAAAVPVGLYVPPGSVLEAFELLVADQVVWSGEAFVVHATEDRIGGRFTSGVLDPQQLRVGATLEGRLALLREQRERLPAEWRAAVADLRQLLEDVKFELDETERADEDDPLRRREEEARLFEGLRARWGAAYFSALDQLHVLSKGLDSRSAVVGQAYASSMLMPLLAACPMNRRAYEKPLGYAGDYRMMELYFAYDHDIGDGLFGRFLYSVTKQYTLVRAVVGRERLMRRAVHEAARIEHDGPVRILALAAGPGIELRRFIEECSGLTRPVELILLDQDRGALESTHRHLTRLLLEVHYGMLPVTVRCLHSSVRQLLKPQTPEDQRLVHETLSELDLVYSAGLYDYLPQRVATRLTRLTYSSLRPGGRLLHGNLMETPDSTWVMDYVLGWPLVYRTPQTLLALGGWLTPVPSRMEIVHDETGSAMFLDIAKPGPA
jgi:extracellular factor (EF) 3-hydroxypalmitic acid methyl ester biosynthesis protein